ARSARIPESAEIPAGNSEYTGLTALCHSAHAVHFICGAILFPTQAEIQREVLSRLPGVREEREIVILSEIAISAEVLFEVEPVFIGGRVNDESLSDVAHRARQIVQHILRGCGVVRVQARKIRAGD